MALSNTLQITGITTTDRTNWLCAQSNGTASITVIIGTGCTGTTSSQLVNNQTYSGQIVVTAQTNSNGTISGTLNVTLQVGTGAASGLIATPNQVNFSVQTGGAAASQNVTITLNGAAVTIQSLTASTTTGQNWLLPSANGSNVLVSVNAAGLSSGTYIGTVTANTSAGTLNFPVNLTVGGIPTLTVSPAQLNFAYQTGTTNPLSQTISLASNGSAVNVSVSSSTNSGGTQWLIVSPLGQTTTPSQITVSVQPAGLPAGVTYVGNILINSSGGATNGTVSIPVNLLVSANPIIASNPASLTFTAQSGGSAPSQTITLASSGAALPYTVTSSVSTPVGGFWLQVPTQSGTTSGAVTVTVNTSGLAVGTYTGAISVSAPNAGNAALTIPVTLNIAAGPVLQLGVPALSFAYQIGQQQPQSQTVTVGSASGQVNFTLSTQTSTGQLWLNASPTSGAAPGVIVVGVSTAGLAAGTYSGSVVLTPVGGTVNTPQTIQVTLVVSNQSLFLISPNAATFTASSGSVSSSFQNVVITSTDGTALNFTVSSTTTSGSNWLLVSSTSGITPANLTITANPAGLAPGTYTGTVTIAAAGSGASAIANSPQSLLVTLNIISTNSLNVSVSSLTFVQAGGASAPPPQTVSVSSGSSITFAAAVSVNQGQNWLTVSPTNATTPTTLTVSANGAGLVAGTYTGQVTLSSPGVASQVIVVTLNVGSGGGGGGLSNGGSLAQVASAGGWTTIITLVNNGQAAAQIQLNFYDNNGNPLPLPLSFPQISGNVNSPATSTVQTINAGATLIIQTTGPPNQVTQVGWAELQSSGDVSGFAVFQQQTPGSPLQEAVVPLEARNPPAFILAYNNTNGYVTTAAIANVSTQTANVNVIIKDGTGAILQSATITVGPLGHADFSLPVNYPVTSQRLGTIEFDTPSGGQISVLGLRFDPAASFSTVPLLVR